MTARLVVLASGSGSNLQAIIDACERNRIDASVAAVFSDRDGAFALERADRHGILSFHFSPSRAETRRAYDQQLADAVEAMRPDWVVLAGWMRILTSAFLDRFPSRVLNLHPARPGELAGVGAIRRAFEEHAAGLRTTTGAMVHLVPDERVDAGPVLRSVDIPIRSTDALADLEARVHAVEHELLVDVLIDLCSDSPSLLPSHSASFSEVRT